MSYASDFGARWRPGFGFQTTWNQALEQARSERLLLLVDRTSVEAGAVVQWCCRWPPVQSASRDVVHRLKLSTIQLQYMEGSAQ